MSGNGYGYYYQPNAPNFVGDPNQSWSEWSLEQQQYNDSYGRANIPHHNLPLNHASTNHSNSFATPPPRSQNFYGNNNGNSRHFAQQRRFSNQSTSFSGQQQNWQRHNYHNKRPRPQDSPGENNMETKSKSSKKKKKPLSQNVPSKKDWTLEEAKCALDVEKDYNKRFKNHSLIIKFPDLELNRDIVSKFHPSIENVHFQQPSTPRFCFVTLKETADAEAIINHLNTIKFGDGYLTAEFKKDREEDQNIGPEDIDPCTLYVGNLAQEITKEDMVKTYPKGRRIDIGYAKKMKYTRYAFVSFKNVTDSIEAFKKTHSTQMYSKSLIVRFRRLHGTVGMPGESKPQSPIKSKPETSNSTGTPEPPNQSQTEIEGILNDDDSLITSSSNVDLNLVKKEIPSDHENDLTFDEPLNHTEETETTSKHNGIKKEIIDNEFDGLFSNNVINYNEFSGESLNRVNLNPEVCPPAAEPPVKENAAVFYADSIVKNEVTTNDDEHIDPSMDFVKLNVWQDGRQEQLKKLRNLTF